MCGIAGSLSWNAPDNPNHIQGMLDVLVHRGPDAEGLVQKDAIILGHRRLAIIDLDQRSNQPLFDHTKQYCITYNGELYNYEEIKKTLETRGAQFKTNSDTEVILEAFKLWGTECLEHFVGMFAFALWDNKNQVLFMARDRMGEKPFFYSPYEGNDLTKGIIFSSELKGMLKHPRVKRELNPEALKQFLALNYILTDSCIFKNIHKLPPAHFLLLKKGSAPLLKCYWDLKESFQSKSTLSEGEALEQFHSLFQQAVRGQMISNVPLGAFLSGGIDSSAVTQFMCSANPSLKPKTFSIGFVEKTYNELAESSRVSEILSTDHHTKIIQGNGVDTIEKILQLPGEPFADNSLIPTYFLSEFARQSVTVALSGDGGDELFGGYETYMADRMFLSLQKCPRFLIRGAHKMASLMPTSFNKVSFDYKAKQFLQGCSLDFHQAHFHWRRIFSGDDMGSLLHDDSLKNWSPHVSTGKFFDDVKDCDPLDQAMYVDMKTWLVDNILVKVDRASMAHSLEVRAPFLDHRLVSFAASLPVSYKIRGFEKKYILKKAMEPYLPKSILYQKKKGFNAPLSLWLNKDLFDFAYETTTAKTLEGMIDLDCVKTLWDDHRREKKDNGFKLFGLLALGVWAKNR